MMQMPELLNQKLWLFMLCGFRLMPLLVFPGISLFTQVPITARMGLLGALSALLALSMNLEPALPQSAGALTGVMLAELCIGTAAALGIHLVFATLRFYGRLVDMQIGFAAAGVVDPTTNNFEALLGSGMAFAALILMLSWNFHHDLLLGLTSSIAAIPFGVTSLHLDPRQLAIILSYQFSLGLVVILPIVISLFLVDVVIAYSSRMMPQVNIYFVSLPLKIAIGLLIAATTLRFAAPALKNMFRLAVSGWPRLVGA